MIRKLRGLGSLGKLKDLPELEQPAKVRAPSAELIHLRTYAVRYAPKVNLLEAAAFPSAVGTLPERIVWKWLDDHDHLYTYQLAEMGGRDVAGGAVIDFTVYDLAAQPVTIRVQGDYWHGSQFPERQARDDEQATRLRQMGYIVLDLWESAIYEAVENDRLTQLIDNELGKA